MCTLKRRSRSSRPTSRVNQYGMLLLSLWYSVKGDNAILRTQQEIIDDSDHVTYTEKLTLSRLPNPARAAKVGVASPSSDDRVKMA